MRYLLTCFCLIAALCNACQQTNPFNGADQVLSEGWEIRAARQVTVSDSAVSTPAFTPEGWRPALVPGTVLGSLVADSVFTDVFYDRNLEKIPDSLFQSPWWYRSSFEVPEKDDKSFYHLRLNGVSYRADIWLNGHKIADKDTLVGSFRRFIINVTPYIQSGKNVLALKVVRALKGDLNIGFVDWNPEPADHHMGIWRDVHLLTTGPVDIRYPFVQTDVDTATLKRAAITVSAQLRNYSSKEVSGTLTGTIGDSLSFSQAVTLPANSIQKVVFSPENQPALQIDNPRLWWVHTLGKPNLYRLRLQFKVEDRRLSDSLSTHFGIRSVSAYTTKDGFRGFRLNGKKILIKGGGWTDPMLLNATPEYEKAGIDYALHMNLNALRMEGFWGMNQHLYNLCDQKGILLMAGYSCQWEWENLADEPDDQHGTVNTPAEMKLAATGWRDQILWLRNHPSIFLWLYGSDKWPRPLLEKMYLDVLRKYDPTRPSVASAKEHVSEITGPTGMKMRGPYDYVPPNYWYVDTLLGGAFGFNTETSPGPEIPVLESLKKMIPADSLWPITASWRYHAARGKFHNLTAYNRAMTERLGKPKSLEDYLRKAQFLNYEGMRAMFEAFESNRFEATGIIQWMYNASWPKLWWQLYDYYLMPTGAFYGARKANEPLHVSYNYKTHGVEVMNNTGQSAGPLTAKAAIYAFLPDTSEPDKGTFKKLWQKEAHIDYLTSRRTLPVFSLPDSLPYSSSWFLRLQLLDQNHNAVSNNTYVLSTQKDLLDEEKSTWYVTPQSQYADLTALQYLPDVHLKMSTSPTTRDSNTYVTVKLKNPSPFPALMVHLNLKIGKSNRSVVPVFWSDNYFTLFPGEERTLKVSCHTRDLKGEQAVITAGGWNVSG